MLSDHQIRNLRKLYESGMDWTSTSRLPRTSQKTWDTLITLGYVDDRSDAEQRLIRLTEKGKRIAEARR